MPSLADVLVEGTTSWMPRLVLSFTLVAALQKHLLFLLHTIVPGAADMRPTCASIVGQKAR
jgi:hypothetical protein